MRLLFVLGPILFSILALTSITRAKSLKSYQQDTATPFTAPITDTPQLVPPIIPTVPPVPSDTAIPPANTTSLSDLLAKAQQYQQTHGFPTDIETGFPLYPLRPDVLGLEIDGFKPDQRTSNSDYQLCGYKAGCPSWNDSNFWAITVLNMSVASDNGFIAVNYYYKERMGGGKETQYAHDGIKYEFYFAVIYQSRVPSMCPLAAIKRATEGFNIKEGMSVVHPDGSVVAFWNEIFQFCERGFHPKWSNE